MRSVQTVTDRQASRLSGTTHHVSREPSRAGPSGTVAASGGSLLGFGIPWFGPRRVGSLRNSSQSTVAEAAAASAAKSGTDAPQPGRAAKPGRSGSKVRLEQAGRSRSDRSHSSNTASGYAASPLAPVSRARSVHCGRNCHVLLGAPGLQASRSSVGCAPAEGHTGAAGSGRDAAPGQPSAQRSGMPRSLQNTPSPAVSLPAHTNNKRRSRLSGEIGSALPSCGSGARAAEGASSSCVTARAASMHAAALASRTGSELRRPGSILFSKDDVTVTGLPPTCLTSGRLPRCLASGRDSAVVGTSGKLRMLDSCGPRPAVSEAPVAAGFLAYPSTSAVSGVMPAVVREHAAGMVVLPSEEAAAPARSSCVANSCCSSTAANAAFRHVSDSGSAFPSFSNRCGRQGSEVSPGPQDYVQDLCGGERGAGQAAGCVCSDIPDDRTAGRTTMPRSPAMAASPFVERASAHEWTSGYLPMKTSVSSRLACANTSTTGTASHHLSGMMLGHTAAASAQPSGSSRDAGSLALRNTLASPTVPSHALPGEQSVAAMFMDSAGCGAGSFIMTSSLLATEARDVCSALSRLHDACVAAQDPEVRSQRLSKRLSSSLGTRGRASLGAKPGTRGAGRRLLPRAVSFNLVAAAGVGSVAGFPTPAQQERALQALVEIAEGGPDAEADGRGSAGSDCRQDGIVLDGLALDGMNESDTFDLMERASAGGAPGERGSAGTDGSSSPSRLLTRLCDTNGDFSAESNEGLNAHSDDSDGEGGVVEYRYGGFALGGQVRSESFHQLRPSAREVPEFKYHGVMPEGSGT